MASKSSWIKPTFGCRAYQIGCVVGQLLLPCLDVAKLDRDVLTFNISQLSKPLPKQLHRRESPRVCSVARQAAASRSKLLNANRASCTLVTAASTSDLLKASTLQNRAIARLRNFPERP